MKKDTRKKKQDNLNFRQALPFSNKKLVFHVKEEISGWDKNLMGVQKYYHFRQFMMWWK